uniref:bifunctional 4-hydroxy-2-oxoglutarate aldolase/2-dehydro-3-deoxy-phosphogluconate aldolase n=1 Tax=Anaerococcus mediterraneensis TaxID=1870984 RepID=UPI00093170A5|nr:bifunctional 4-hydroxy-2-oxoglutarate aldolase/2-dehydro-3-deoxy-phosphogluconate aldolase [Anaerococcus mediterraneensis]
MSKDRFEKCGIIPVVVIDKVEDAYPLAKALYDGGIDVAEVTFRTDAAKDAIKEIAEKMPEVYVGAGTIINVDQADAAIEAGAKFIVSPGYDPEIVARCQEKDIPVFPGVVSPTEIMMAIKDGIKVVKFFPAGIFGGLKAIKSLAGPFPNIKFMPTGGVNIDNLKEFLSFEKIHAVGGSWICDQKLVQEGKWDEISTLCRQAREIYESVR